MKKEKPIESLIHNYLKGSLSLMDEELLYQWLKESSDNRLYFQKRVKTDIPEIADNERFKSALKETKSRLFKKLPSDQKQSNKLITFETRRWIELAAVLILGILLKVTIDYFANGNSMSNEEYCRIEAPIGQKSKVTLPDGTLVVLNADSEILFKNNFSKDRTVKLNGEAYFEVTKDAKHEFMVLANGYNVVVHGTQFNVMSYPDFGYTQTTLVEGSVEIRKGNQHIFLQSGDQLKLKDGQFTKKQINTELATAWKDNKFYFDSVEFSELVRRLERWYDVEIEIENEELLAQEFTGVFKNEETIWQVLNALQHFISFEYERDNFRQIIIK